MIGRRSAKSGKNPCVVLPGGEARVLGQDGDGREATAMRKQALKGKFRVPETRLQFLLKRVGAVREVDGRRRNVEPF
jgi:hypothetical protein